MSPVPEATNPFPPRLIFFISRAELATEPITRATGHFRVHFPHAPIVEVGPAVAVVATEQGVAIYGAPYLAPDWKNNQREGELLLTLYVDRLALVLEGVPE